AQPGPPATPILPATPPMLPDSAAARTIAAFLNARSEDLPAEHIVGLAIECFGRQIAAISSFGADSAVLLHMIAAHDRSVPVLFLDTGKHFEETVDYRDALVSDLGL